MCAYLWCVRVDLFFSYCFLATMSIELHEGLHGGCGEKTASREIVDHVSPPRQRQRMRGEANNSPFLPNRLTVDSWRLDRSNHLTLSFEYDLEPRPPWSTALPLPLPLPPPPFFPCSAAYPLNPLNPLNPVNHLPFPPVPFVKRKRHLASPPPPSTAGRSESCRKRWPAPPSRAAVPLGAQQDHRQRREGGHRTPPA